MKFHLRNKRCYLLIIDFALIALSYYRLSYASAYASLHPTEEVLIEENFLSTDDCNLIVSFAEETGFNYNFDSIDSGEAENVNSQDLIVLDGKFVKHNKIWGVLSPYLRKAANLIRNHRQMKECAKLLINDVNYNCSSLNQLDDVRVDWIFLRKYSPMSPRNSLRLHRDTNENTILIALNGHISGDQAKAYDRLINDEKYGPRNDYHGGGFFYVKSNNTDDYYHATTPDEYVDMTNYDWLDTLNRFNTSLLHFPHLDKGTAVVYDPTLWHGVAPLTAGTRYSVSIFYNIIEYMNKSSQYLKETTKSTIAFRNNLITDELLNVRYVTTPEVTTDNHEPDVNVSPSGKMIIDSRIMEWNYDESISITTYLNHVFQICYGEYLITTCEVITRDQICDVNINQLPPEIRYRLYNDDINYDSRTRLRLCVRLNV